MNEKINPMPTTDPDVQTQHAGPSPALVVFLVIPLVGLLVALVMIAMEGGGQANNATGGLPQNTNTLINYPAPNFEVRNMQGETIALADYAGRALVLNFWQTTCAPCVRELPALADFAAAEGETGAAVLAINFDETSQMISDFFAENGISGVPVALDPNSDVRRTYNVQGIPVTYIIAPDGTVRFRHLGEVTYEELEQYVDLTLNTDPSA